VTNPLCQPELARYFIQYHFRYWPLFLESELERDVCVSNTAEIGINIAKNYSATDKDGGFVAYVDSSVSQSNLDISRRIHHRLYRPATRTVPVIRRNNVLTEIAMIQDARSRVAEERREAAAAEHLAVDGWEFRGRRSNANVSMLTEQQRQVTVWLVAFKAKRKLNQNALSVFLRKSALDNNYTNCRYSTSSISKILSSQGGILLKGQTLNHLLGLRESMSLS
jgi:hypothetical protein